MIQLVRSTAISSIESIYLDLYSEMTNDDHYLPLFTFTSQASGSSFTTLPLGALYTDKERFVQIRFFIQSSLIPSIGFVTFGTTDLPYGLYDVIVYQNSSNVNLDPSGLNVVWNGLANLSAEQTGTYKNPAVEYTDYNTNDTDTESVYITC